MSACLVTGPFRRRVGRRSLACSLGVPGGSVGFSQALTSESILGAAGVIGEDAQDLGGARGELWNRIGRDIELSQRLFELLKVDSALRMVFSNSMSCSPRTETHPATGVHGFRRVGGLQSSQRTRPGAGVAGGYPAREAPGRWRFSSRMPSDRPRTALPGSARAAASTKSSKSSPEPAPLIALFRPSSRRRG